MKLFELFKKLFAVLCLSVVFCGCMSAEDNVSASLYVKKSSYGESLYVAQASSMQTASRELSECLFRVARQISMRKQVFVRYVVEGNNTNVMIDFDQNNSMAILDTLSVIESVRTAEGTEVVVKQTGKTGFKTPAVSIKTGYGAKPSWITNPPSGSKFYAAVGSVVRNSNTYDGFSNSDMKAIGALAPFLVKPVISGSTKMYETVMNGVYIGQRWYDSAENRYYSLAILPK